MVGHFCPTARCTPRAPSKPPLTREGLDVRSPRRPCVEPALTNGFRRTRAPWCAGRRAVRRLCVEGPLPTALGVRPTGTPVAEGFIGTPRWRDTGPGAPRWRAERAETAESHTAVARPLGKGATVARRPGATAEVPDQCDSKSVRLKMRRFGGWDWDCDWDKSARPWDRSVRVVGQAPTRAPRSPSRRCRRRAAGWSRPAWRTTRCRCPPPGCRRRGRGRRPRSRRP